MQPQTDIGHENYQKLLSLVPGYSYFAKRK